MKDAPHPIEMAFRGDPAQTGELLERLERLKERNSRTRVSYLAAELGTAWDNEESTIDDFEGDPDGTVHVNVNYPRINSRACEAPSGQSRPG